MIDENIKTAETVAQTVEKELLTQVFTYENLKKKQIELLDAINLAQLLTKIKQANKPNKIVSLHK